MPKITDLIPADPVAMLRTGNPNDLPGDLYDAIIEVYAGLVSINRNPLASVPATARTMEAAARQRGYTANQAARLGDMAAMLCQEIATGILLAVD